MSKMTDKTKVALLENAVIAGNLNEVKAVIETHGTFEFSARAFGIACLYADSQMVKLLAENTMTFHYTKEAEQKYKIQMKTYSDTYSPDYAMMLAYTDNTFWDSYHFGMLPEITAGKNSTQTRLGMLEFFFEDPDHYGINLSKLLYYAVLWRNREMVDVLLNHGVSLADKQIRWLTATERFWHRDELTWAIRHMPESDLIYVLQTYATLLQKVGKKIALTHAMVASVGFGKTEINDTILQPSVIRLILDTANVEKMKKGEILELLVQTDNMESLELLVQAGWMKTTAQKEKLMQCARDCGKTGVLAWLMDYNARTTDPEKEQAKEEAKMRRALAATPSPTAQLKKLWNYQKRDDGNLAITGYKGSETVVNVPAVIGRENVTVIGTFSFFPWASRIKNGPERKAIERIVIPEGIRMIDHEAICCIDKLTEVVIPASVRFIGHSNFMQCPVTIHAPAGSYAETYAKNHSIPFVAE